MSGILYDGFVKELRDALEAVMDDMTEQTFKRGMDALNKYDRLLKDRAKETAPECPTPEEPPA